MIPCLFTMYCVILLFTMKYISSWTMESKAESVMSAVHEVLKNEMHTTGFISMHQQPWWEVKKNSTASWPLGYTRSKGTFCNSTNLAAKDWQGILHFPAHLRQHQNIPAILERCWASWDTNGRHRSLTASAVQIVSKKIYCWVRSIYWTMPFISTSIHKPGRVFSAY